jgi:hypothetical protein
MDSLKWLGLQSIVCELGRFMAINGPYFHQPYRDSSSRHVPVPCSDSLIRVVWLGHSVILLDTKILPRRPTR